MKKIFGRYAIAAALVALFCLAGNSAFALDTVKLGKAVPNSFAFGAAEVGQDAKIFAQEGLALQISSFHGDAQLQQALATGAVDFGLGSGPALGFHVKGVPAIGVAALFGPPQNMALLVAPNSPVKSIADLKGKRVGVTTAGSLTDWLVRELSRQQGWGNDGIEIVPMGDMPARVAAMDRGDIAGTVQEAASGYELEDQNKAKILLLFGDRVKDFYTHVIFATDTDIDKHPELVTRFLRGWFKTVAFMKANKDFTVKSEAKTLGVRPSVVSKVYDAQMAYFSTDGAWNQTSLKVIRRSLKQLGILETEPPLTSLYTDKFVPVKF